MIARCRACGLDGPSKVVAGVVYPERHKLKSGRWCRGTVEPATVPKKKGAGDGGAMEGVDAGAAARGARRGSGAASDGEREDAGL